MDFEIKPLRQRAREALGQGSCSAKKLIGIHTGVMLASGLVLSLLQFYLSQSIGSTGGLGGIGARTFLETIQSLLQIANSLLLPFWSIGLIFAMLRLVTGGQTGPGDLLEGFRHFGPVLRLNLLKWGIYLLVIFVASQIGSTVYMMTPMAQPFYDLAEQLMLSETADPSALLSQEQIMEMALAMVPFLLGAMLLLMVPVAYRLRMMDYVLVDQPEMGAFYALRMSLAMTKGHCWKLFKLDISFWWFYLLELLAAVICYADLLLPLVGVSLPVPPETASFGFYALGLLCQLGLYIWQKDQLAATYALAYEALLPPPPVTQQA